MFDASVVCVAVVSASVAFLAGFILGSLLSSEAKDRELNSLRRFLARCIPFVEIDARMAADLTRFSPLPQSDQDAHDSCEWASEVLLRDLSAAGVLEDVCHES